MLDYGGFKDKFFIRVGGIGFDVSLLVYCVDCFKVGLGYEIENGVLFVWVWV